jgi:hypothetical protein
VELPERLRATSQTPQRERVAPDVPASDVGDALRDAGIVVVEAPHPAFTLRWLDEGLAASALITDRPPLAGAAAERAADVATVLVSPPDGGDAHRGPRCHRGAASRVSANGGPARQHRHQQTALLHEQDKASLEGVDVAIDGTEATETGPSKLGRYH